MEQYGRFASVYDLFMDGVDYDAWAEYLASFISKGSNIIECGCGTGEITIRLKKKGFDVAGVDISDDMLDVAAHKARKAGVRIPFVRMDMSKLAWHRPVECIVAPCDCVNYLTSFKKVESFFNCAYSHLKPGGMLIFDVSSRYKLSTILACNTFFDSKKDAAYIWRNNYDAENRLIEMNLEFFKFCKNNTDGTPLFERFLERHIQRAHSERELRSWLHASGFTVEAIYADFTANLPAETSERLHFIAKKS